MSDIMSQNEIDDLLNALSTGEVDVDEIEEEKKAKKIKKYDFRRPEKFAKEQLRTLEVIHENLGRSINNFLSGYLRTVIDIAVISTESMVYSEFSNSVSNPAILGIVDFSPLEGQIILEINNNLAFSMIEKLLGGKSSGELKGEARELTEIEEVLIKGILEKMIQLMREAWSNIIELKPGLDNIETNSQFAQIVSPSESIALITYNVKIGELEGMINVGIPHYVIEPILSSLSSKLWFGANNKRVKNDSETHALIGNIESSSMAIKAVLGKSTINISELLSLTLGDVLVLDTRQNQPFEVFVKEELKFYGMPGVFKNKMAVKITEVVEQEGVVTNG